MRLFVLQITLAAGCIGLVGNQAFAQTEHRGGWPQQGELHWSVGQDTAPPTIRAEATVADPRLVFHGNRWWYWTAQHKLMVWNDGQWRDYAAATPDTDTAVTTKNDPKPADTADLSGWYWRDSEKRWYLFDGKSLKPGP